MSNVTNAILSHSCIEGAPADELHVAVEAAGITSGQFTRVDKHGVGTKSMEVAVYVAAFNHLDEPALLGAIRSVKWISPDHVQLFLCRQEEFRFTEIDLFD